jgi:hypothetical protein
MHEFSEWLTFCNTKGVSFGKKSTQLIFFGCFEPAE